MLIDFYADWCISCKEMEATLFHDQDVQSALKPFVLIRVDVTANNQNTKQVQQYFSVIAPPTFIWLNAQGKMLPALKTVGAVNKSEFLKTVLVVK